MAFPSFDPFFYLPKYTNVNGMAFFGDFNRIEVNF